MILADKIKDRGLDLDLERVLKMALVHDWAETRVGDMPRTATNYFGVDIRKTAETRAFADVVANLDGAQFNYTEIYHDYEQRESVEARLVKAADVIDLLLQAYALECAGAKGLDEFWEVAEEADFKLPPVAHEVVIELLRSLLDVRSRIE
jgi:putative hydrolase of HD superfamily